jgi:hypothetical protein
MMKILRDRTITNETLVVDETGFYNCCLSKCILQYSGGEFIIDNTPINECRWEFTSAALCTIELLTRLGILHNFPASGWVGGTVNP